jgi:replicative superfamily II helicase
MIHLCVGGASLLPLLMREVPTVLQLLLCCCYALSQEGHSVLIFCGTKARCRDTATLISQCIQIPERTAPTGAAAAAAAHDEYTPASGQQQQQHTQAVAAADGKTARQRLAEKLASPVFRGVNGLLRDLLLQGVAWHNADLSHEERLLVEEVYSTGQGALGFEQALFE